MNNQCSRIEPTYENITAKCTYCESENIYNRITDLKTIELIDFKTVVCNNCQKKFNINGDSIGEAYEYLIYDVSFMKDKKRYMYCILNLAQATEFFLFYAIKVKLLFLPYKQKNIKTQDSFNLISKKINENMEKFTFVFLRNIFFELYINNHQSFSPGKINKFLDRKKLNKIKSRQQNDWTSSINNLSDSKLRDLFCKLLYMKVPDLRNKVVHKRAYRPNLNEVEQSIKETRDIVFRLKAHLQIRGHNYYIK